MKVFKLTEKALKYYQTTVRGNKDVNADQAARKLSRNIQLVKEMAPERIKTSILGTTYSYGNLDITVRLGKIVHIKNSWTESNDFHINENRYIELSDLLEIEDCKFQIIRE